MTAVGLVYLRGAGEASWVSHHAPDVRLTATPAGLECRLADAWGEAARQGRRGLLVLGHEIEAARAAVPELGRRPAQSARSHPTRVVALDTDADASESLRWLGQSDDHRLVALGTFRHEAAAAKLAPLVLELQLPSPPGPRSRPWAGSTPRLVEIPGGSFRMGSPDHEPGRWPDEGPRRTVTVAPFRLAIHPVTNADFAAFLADDPDAPMPASWSETRFGEPDQPVVGVGWELAGRYANWAGGRLPSEAEWEYACRAATSGSRYGALDEIAWHAGNSGGCPRPVGRREPNDFGLFDTLGNVWEWVADVRHDTYAGAPEDATPWLEPPDGEPVRRLLRGGSWADSPRTVRAATRLTEHPGPRVGNVGLRLAADL